LPENDFEILLQNLNSDNYRVKAILAYCIGKRKDKKYENELLVLLDQSNPFVRGMAIDALGELKSEIAVPQLMGCLYDFAHVFSNSKERVCDKASMALLSIGTQDAIARLKNWALIMIGRRIADEQTTPLIVLEKVGNNEAVPRLSKILRYKKSWISSYARRTLLGIGTSEALEAIEKFDKRVKHQKSRA